MLQTKHQIALMKRYCRFIEGLHDDCRGGGLVLTDYAHCVFHIFHEFDPMALRDIESEMKMPRSESQHRSTVSIVCKTFMFNDRDKMTEVKEWARNYSRGLF